MVKSGWKRFTHGAESINFFHQGKEANGGDYTQRRTQSLIQMSIQVHSRRGLNAYKMFGLSREKGANLF